MSEQKRALKMESFDRAAREDDIARFIEEHTVIHIFEWKGLLRIVYIA